MLAVRSRRHRGQRCVWPLTRSEARSRRPNLPEQVTHAPTWWSRQWTKRRARSSALRTRGLPQSRWDRRPRPNTTVSSGEIVREHSGHVAVRCSAIGASPMRRETDGPDARRARRQLASPRVLQWPSSGRIAPRSSLLNVQCSIQIEVGMRDRIWRGPDEGRSAGGSRLGSGKTGRRPCTGFRSLDVAIARRGRRDERVEELPDCVRHLVHGTSERDFVGFGGSCETAELSDELQRRCPDFVVRGRWLEVVQRLDAATHRKSSSSTYRLLIGIAHSVSSLSAHSMSCTRIAGLAKEAFLPTKSSSRTPRALEHAPHTWIGVPSATVVRRASARGGASRPGRRHSPPGYASTTPPRPEGRSGPRDRPPPVRSHAEMETLLW